MQHGAAIMKRNFDNFPSLLNLISRKLKIIPEQRVTFVHLKR